MIGACRGAQRSALSGLSMQWIAKWGMRSTLGPAACRVARVYEARAAGERGERGGRVQEGAGYGSVGSMGCDG